LRELEQKMKLENDRYEELMIDLALLKKQGQHKNGSSALSKGNLSWEAWETHASTYLAVQMTGRIQIM
jgi:hypothetical protein